MIEQLTALGLTVGEARVYFALLKLGSSKIGQIVKESRVSYSKVYDILARLSLKGLVSYITIGKVRYYSAAEPYRLNDYIQKKEQNLQREKEIVKRIIPDLLKFAGAGSRSSAEIFVGLKGLRTAYEILLQDASKNDVLRYFYPFEDYHETATPFYEGLYLFQQHKELVERGIGTVKFKKSKHYGKLKHIITNMRFVSFPLPGTMDMFHDSILIVSWKNTTGILISSKEITNHFKQYFDSIWHIASK
jgi:predicted transcriptional regulator